MPESEKNEIKIHVIGKPFITAPIGSQVGDVLKANGITLHEGWNIYVDMAPVDSNYVLGQGQQVIVKPEIKGNQSKLK